MTDRAIAKTAGAQVVKGRWLDRRLMEAHSGTIEISSEPGKGTEVRLYFPIEVDGGETLVPRRRTA